MSPPSLVIYASEAEYRSYYEREYCTKYIETFDGIRVFFSKRRFKHAFYESTQRNETKNQFSKVRAERIDWIKATLEDKDSDQFQGWDRKKRKYDPNFRVSNAFEDFVVVLRIAKTSSGRLKAEFWTAYKADNSISRIKSSPHWDPKLVK